MTRMRYWFVGVSILLLASNPIEAESKLPIPQDFYFKGRPIQPECIGQLIGDSSRFETIYLEENSCQKTQKEFDPDGLKQGFLGYSSSGGSYSYYKYLGPIHLHGLQMPIYHLIYLEWSGGGTGRFTAIDIIDKTQNSIRLVSEIDGGDRCNGGLYDVVFKDGILTYKKNVTPWALYSIAQGTSDTNIHFSDCAVCCVGTVNYKGSDMVGFEFYKDSMSILENNSLNSSQDCYNTIIKETFVLGKTSLTPDELKSFGQKVKERCLAGKGNP